MHQCYEQMNAHLNPKGCELTFAMQVPSGVELLVIATNKLRARGAKPVRVMATYCPFCGKSVNDKGFSNPKEAK